MSQPTINSPAAPSRVENRQIPRRVLLQNKHPVTVKVNPRTGAPLPSLTLPPVSHRKKPFNVAALQKKYFNEIRDARMAAFRAGHK